MDLVLAFPTNTNNIEGLFYPHFVLPVIRNRIQIIAQVGFFVEILS
jgi:hypothetical protein